MVYDPFNQITASDIIPVKTSAVETCSSSISLSTTTTTTGLILGIDEKYVLGIIIGMMIIVFIEE